MRKLSKREMILVAGATMVSMAAGIAIGCMKEKMRMDSCCIIDEM